MVCDKVGCRSGELRFVSFTYQTTVCCMFKVRQIVVWLKKSPQRQARLKQYCRRSECQELEPIQDVSTRWSSMLHMVARIILLRPAVELFIMADAELEEINLSRMEWESLPRLRAMLQDMAEVTRLVEGDKYVHFIFRGVC